MEPLLGNGGLSSKGLHGDRYSVLELWGQIELRRLILRATGVTERVRKQTLLFSSMFPHFIANS